jgi:phosphatidate cytidylyltransferase
VLKTRIISALILIPFILGSVYVGGLAFFALVAIALLVAGWEFFDMARRAGHRPMMWFGLTFIALILLDTQFKWNLLREFILVLVCVSLVVGIFQHTPGWLTGWAYTIAGVLYVGLIGAYFILVRNLPNETGLLWTSLALLTSWANDSAAYLAGTRLGKHGFFTQISPKKTWEGAVGGFVASVLTMIAASLVFQIPFAFSIVFGAGLSIAAILGDLAESLIKRQTGVKDSSNIIPGHGGLLDRIDSLLSAAVFAYYYLVWFLPV